MPRMIWKIDLGHIITIVVTVAMVSIAWGNLRAEIGYLKEEVALLRHLPERVARVEALVEKRESK